MGSLVIRRSWGDCGEGAPAEREGVHEADGQLVWEFRAGTFDSIPRSPSRDHAFSG